MTEDHRYEGRPGLSPAAATLLAQGLIRRSHRILDVGCGKGTDSLLLTKWGFRSVLGIDPDPGSIGIARRRASRLGLAARVRFEPWGAEELPERLEKGRIDVALHTLVANNLRKGFEAHFAGLAHAMRRQGLLVLTMRTVASEENARPGRVRPVKGLEAYFDVGASVSLQLAESGDYAPPYARAVVWIGRRR